MNPSVSRYFRSSSWIGAPPDRSGKRITPRSGLGGRRSSIHRRFPRDRLCRQVVGRAAHPHLDRLHGDLRQPHATTPIVRPRHACSRAGVLHSRGRRVRWRGAQRAVLPPCERAKATVEDRRRPRTRHHRRNRGIRTPRRQLPRRSVAWMMTGARPPTSQGVADAEIGYPSHHALRFVVVAEEQ